MNVFNIISVSHLAQLSLLLLIVASISLFILYIDNKLLDIVDASNENFHNETNKLLADDELPLELLKLLQFMNANITSRLVPWLFAVCGVWIGFKQSSRPKTQTELEAFFQRRPELEKIFNRILMNWFLAISNLGFFSHYAIKLALKLALYKHIMNEVELTKRVTSSKHNFLMQKLAYS